MAAVLNEYELHNRLATPRAFPRNTPHNAGFPAKQGNEGNELSFNEERQLTDGVEVADQEVARNGRKGGQAGQRLGWMPKPSTRSTAAS